MIKITEDKLGTMAENIERGLRYVGKAMQCVDELQRESYGERSGYGMRHGYGMRDDDMNYRYPVMDEEEMGMRGGYGERRGRNSMGRYTSY